MYAYRTSDHSRAETGLMRNVNKLPTDQQASQRLTAKRDEVHVCDAVLPANGSKRSDGPPQPDDLARHVHGRVTKVQSSADHPVAANALEEQFTKTLVDLGG